MATHVEICLGTLLPLKNMCGMFSKLFGFLCVSIIKSSGKDEKMHSEMALFAELCTFKAYICVIISVFL